MFHCWYTRNCSTYSMSLCISRGHDLDEFKRIASAQSMDLLGSWLQPCFLCCWGTQNWVSLAHRKVWRARWTLRLPTQIIRVANTDWQLVLCFVGWNPSWNPGCLGGEFWGRFSMQSWCSMRRGLLRRGSLRSLWGDFQMFHWPSICLSSIYQCKMNEWDAGCLKDTAGPTKVAFPKLQLHTQKVAFWGFILLFSWVGYSKVQSRLQTPKRHLWISRHIGS